MDPNMFSGIDFHPGKAIGCLLALGVIIGAPIVLLLQWLLKHIHIAWM